MPRALGQGSGRSVTRRRIWALAAAAVLVVAAVIGGVVVMSGAKQTTPVAQDAPANTAKVEQGKLSAMVSQDGILTYRARPDGSPYAVINQARGVYTRLPENADKVGCGGVLYRVDDKPVVLLCGTVPAYRDLHTGDAGQDVGQLNRDLRQLGYDADAHVHVDASDNNFTFKTEKALKVLQHDKGLRVTGALALGDVVFLPESVRIAKVTGALGGSARPGAPVLNATSDKLHVQVNLDPSQQGEVKKGDRAQVTLPGNTPVSAKVDGFGSVAQVPAGQDSEAADATIPTFISLDDPGKARGLDQAPVQVDITTKGVERALSVPVTALVGKSGGGYAVEAVRTGGRRELVAVTLGLFDTGGGRVQVEGDLRAGDAVVVPSL
jgi:peptidoglycan hydrolase-like protein with peptidoglycan-binding domain